MSITLVLVFSLVLNIIVLLLAAYLIKWRMVTQENQISIVPPELLRSFEKNKRAVSLLLKKIKSLEKLQVEKNEKIIKLNNESTKYLSLLTKNVNQKDKELQRLKEGYDYRVFKNFLNRFMKIHHIVGEELQSYSRGFDKKDESIKNIVSFLETLRVLLEDAFLECGLDSFAPKKGEGFKEAFGVSSDFEPVYTEDEGKNMKIAKIKSKGFKLDNEFGEKVVKPSFVQVYIYKKGA